MRPLLVTLLLVLAVDAIAQQTVYDGTTIIYKKELEGGLILHGDGWGLDVFHGKHRTARSRRMIGVEIVSMKHPKEIKSFNPYYEDSRGYFYGKLNSLLLIRPTWGRKELLTDKLRKSGVEVNYLWGIGASIGYLKPVYLQIGKPGIPYETIDVERYDPSLHYPDDIFGRASWFKGFGEGSFVTGAFARFAFNFEYSGNASGIKALEAGASVDAFPTKVPVMAELDGVENKQFFFEFYVSLKFGKKFVR
ncbi:MAG: hypothetical protein H6595_00840 [Flavobacteriales bacterium]|nr:hypothetical protein [Flavobacteriales bacterium]MCB9166004.1 hypothetical protein [Flavobacteriales bacterium]